MSKITKHAKEVQMQQIFRMLLEAKTQEEIAHELNVALKTVQRYTQELDQRYGASQRQKTDDTLYLECSLFKNRMLTLYKILEDKATQLKSSGAEVAKCCEVAANIAIDVLRIESEGIKSIREVTGYGRLLQRQQQQERFSNSRIIKDNTNNEESITNNNDAVEQSTTTNPNRKF